MADGVVFQLFRYVEPELVKSFYYYSSECTLSNYSVYFHESVVGELMNIAIILKYS
jgi:hypothetical protein